MDVTASVIRNALKTYKGSLAVAFNGGKDGCVVLDLLHRLDPCALSNMLVVHFAMPDEFPQLAEFVAETRKRYNLARFQAVSCNDIRTGVVTCLADNPDVRAFITGRRSTDPYAEQSHCTPSTQGWPVFMRISPILHWTYRDVWHYLRAFQVPYPALYDAGFTSLGSQSSTCRNPALRRADGTYAPAFELNDAAQERAGRI